MSKTLKTWPTLLVAGLLVTSAPYAVSATVESAAPQAAQQADGACTGTVLDSMGDPLMGATVRAEGTSIAGATNLDGEFSLRGVKIGTKITFNYIGMKPKTVVWNGTPINVTLEDDSNVLDEVVVMGYGIQQKRAKVTNSIAKVSSETLTVGSNANPAQALAGAVSGVKVNVNSGDPSATPSIVIRGGTNWSGDSNPLVVVDGQIRSSLSDINPNDIESMEILKDAGATALYGARAANGVILITSKTGKEANGRVTLSAKYGVTNYSSGYEYADAETYINYFRRALFTMSNPNPTNAGNPAGTTWLHNFYGMLNAGSQGFSTGNTVLNPAQNYNILTMTEDNKYLLEKGWKSMPDPLNGLQGWDNINRTILYRDTDILGVNANTATATQDYNLSFSGGNDRGNYYASLGYYKADGALPTTFYERYNFAFTGGYKISQWLTANSIFNFTRANWNNNSKGLNNGYVFSRYASAPPTARINDEDGNDIYGYAGMNLNYQKEAWKNENQSDKFQMTQSLTANLIDGLSVTGTMSWYYTEQLNSSFQADHDSNAAGAQYVNRATSKSADRTFEQTYKAMANFNRTFNEVHTVSAALAVEYYKRQYKSLAASGNKAPTDDFDNLQYSFTGTQNPYVASSLAASNYIYEDAIMSYVGQVAYDYDDKYLFQTTFREDGYSRLQNNRWGAFPGVSGGWVFTKENFWSENDALSFLNYGKIRASFGLNGIVNPNVIGYYTLLGSYSGYQYGGQTGFRISGLPNLNLRWERTRTFDMGLTFGFLQNRFNVDIAYYNRLTMDKYANKTLPPTTGFSSVVNNNGKFRNQGVEIDLNGTLLRTRDFSWTLGLNITYNKNIVVELPDNKLERNRQDAFQVYSGDGNKMEWVGGLQEGQEPNHFFGFKKDHMLRSWADVEAMGDYIDISRTSPSAVNIYANESGLQRLKDMGLSAGAVRLSPGDLVWKDINGDNMIESYDRFDLGNLIPHWTGGFNTRFTWKGLSLYARFDMGFGFTVYDPPYAWSMGGGQGAFNFMTDIKDTWTPENPNAKLPRFVDASNMGTDSWIRASDLIACSGAYLACRELSLSYELPKNIASKFRSQGLTLSVTGQNLGYLKKTTLPLPDKRPDYSNGASAGNGGTYNLPVNVIFGLNLSF